MKRKVLIVEDNDISREILYNMLQDEYQVLEAENGVDAIRIVEQEKDSLSAVVLDLVMPKMDGFEVMDRMQKNQEMSHIPIMIATVTNDREIEGLALESGAIDYVTKPYDARILRSRLANTIKLREQAASINAVRVDALTGLESRAAFFEHVKELVSKKEPGYYILSAFDIDCFKVINDQYGNAKGDQVLRQIAGIFREEFRKVGAIMSRIMADNFAILYPKSFSNTEAIGLIRERASVLDGTMAPISYSIGRYYVEDISVDPSVMYDRAIIAKQSVKGRYDAHIAVYEDKMRDHILSEQEIINGMKQALQRHEFEIWFQPQFSHMSGALIGAEALTRWRHPEKGLIMPVQFIPIFERNGFVYELDKYVWEQACIFIRDRLKAQRPVPPIALNLSRYDVFRPDLCECILGLVKQYKIPRELLQFEITESAFEKASEKIIDVVKELQSEGFVIEIDDFGSGYSSLNILKDVPADVVKLDMRFLSGEDNVSRGGSILEAIVRMTKWLGMSVIAEGVEDLRQADFLKSIGCYYVQGYLYSKPIPADEFEKVIEEKGYAEKMVTLEKVKTFNNQAFWDPTSMDTLIFNSYVGGACIFEYMEGKIEILRTNDEYIRILYGDSRMLSGSVDRDWYPYMSTDTQKKTRAILRKAIMLKTEVCDELELINFGDTGRKINVYAKMRVIARTGNRFLFYCVLEDITSLRETEKHEKQLMEQMQIILNDMNGGVIVYQIEKDGTQKMVFANEQFYLQRGYTREQYEAEVTRPFHIVHPDDVHHLEEQSSRAKKDGSSSTTIYRVIKRDGSIIWVRSRMSLAVFDGYSEPMQIAISEDITSEREADIKERKSKVLMDSVLSNVGNGITAVTLNESKAEYLFSNDRFYSILKYTREQFQEKVSDIFSIFHPDDRDRVRDAVQKLIPGNPPLILEYRAICGDGSVVNIRMTVVSIHYVEEGKTVQISVFEDITEETAQDRRQKELIENLPCGAGIFELSGDMLSVLYLNEQYWRLVGRTPGPGGVTSVWDSILESDREYLRATLKNVENSGREQECELHIKNGEGGYSPFLVRINVMQKKTEMLTLYVTYTSINEDAVVFRQMLPMALDAMMSSTNDFSFVKDRTLTYVCASHAFAGMVGIEDEKKIIGMTDFNLYGKSTASKYHEEELELMRKGKSQTDYVDRIRTKDGKIRYTSMSKYLLKDSIGNIIGIYGTGRDITENREAYDRLMLLIDTIPGGLATYEITANGIRTLYISEGVYELSGYSTADFSTLRNNPLMFVHEEDRERLISLSNEVYLKKISVDCDYRICKKNGEVCWVNLRGAVADCNGDRVIMNTVITDISDQRKTNARLELLEHDSRLRYEQELQLRKGLIQSSVLYYQINLTSGVIEEFETKFYSELQLKIGAIADQPARSILAQKILPDDIDKVYEVLSLDNLRKSYKRGERTQSVIYRRKLNDEDYHWVRMKVFFMQKPDNGDGIAFLHCNDIDSKQRAGQSIETILNEDIESVIYVSVKSGTGAVAHVIDKAGQYNNDSRYQFDEESRKWRDSRVLKDDREKFSEFYCLKKLVRQLEKNNVVNVVFRVLDNGEIRRKLSKACYMDEQRDYIVITCRDITLTYNVEERQKEELKEALEKANEANQAKSEFLSHVSHDLRTPLNAVLAFSNQELMENANESELREYLAKVNVSGEYLLGIINDVLDMSRIEQNRIKLNPEPYFLETFEATIRNVIGELCRKKSINFVYDFHKINQKCIMVDKVRFNQIFINLLSNAVKFTRSGGKIEFIAEERPFGDHQVMKRFIVRDNGIGMSREFIPHAFESFNQEYREDVSEKNQGTGLGLAIVKELVGLMSGTIALESKLHVGTTFVVEIPFASTDFVEDDEVCRKYDVNLLMGKRFLLAEDNDLNAEITQRLLEKYGVTLDRAENGQEACERFGASPAGYYAMILMDVRMPVMGGIAATMRIRSMDREDAGAIPIIAMTADAFLEDEKKTLESGMNAHVTKPIDPERLYSICCGFLSAKEEKQNKRKK